MDAKTPAASPALASRAPYFSCQQLGGAVIAPHECFKITHDKNRAVGCGGCKSPNRLCYACLLEGRTTYVAGPPNFKGLCLMCLGFKMDAGRAGAREKPIVLPEPQKIVALPVQSPVSLPKAEPPPPVQAAAEEILEADVSEIPVPADAVIVSGPNVSLEPLDVARRVVLAKTGGGKMPYAIEIFSAVAMLSEKMSNAEIGSIFGQTETSAAAWTYVVLRLRKLSEASWRIIHNAELGGRHVSLSWAAKIARSDPATHLAQLQKWAAATKYVRYKD